RLEAERRQDARRARVPWIGRDEGSGRGVQGVEGGSSFGLGRHDLAPYSEDTLTRRAAILARFTTRFGRDRARPEAARGQPRIAQVREDAVLAVLDLAGQVEVRVVRAVGPEVDDEAVQGEAEAPVLPGLVLDAEVDVGELPREVAVLQVEEVERLAQE